VNDVFAKVNARRDLVLVDQRGTGGSNPLSCPRDHVLVADAAAVAAYVRRCFAQLDGEPRFYTTAVAMDDLEAVRRALGYGRIDLYGGSYGATAAQIFLRRHPRSVRTLILDGASLLDVPVYELQARNGERGLRVDLARCAAAAACRRAFPDTRAELDALLAERPRRMELAGHDPFVLDGDAVASTIRALSRTPEGAALVPRLVHDAAGGNDVPLAQAYASEVGPELDPRARLATSFVILCSEPWARFGVAATIRASAGTYLEHVTVAHARLFRRACGAVPKGVVPADSGDPPRSRVPVLLVTGGADPQDPPANLAGWRAAFPNGRLIVLKGVGHGAIERGCLPLVAARFVARGTAAELDASCVRAIRLPPFET
jgi:pimeloyl-ACP methyl ester carboxylesterase